MAVTFCVDMAHARGAIENDNIESYRNYARAVDLVAGVALVVLATVLVPSPAACMAMVGVGAFQAGVPVTQWIVGMSKAEPATPPATPPAAQPAQAQPAQAQAAAAANAEERAEEEVAEERPDAADAAAGVARARAPREAELDEVM